MLAELIDLRRGIDEDSLVPCFQPIVELRTRRLCAFEVLARWKHPRHGLVLPTNFISLAEEHGLIEQLSQQILRKAFKVSPGLPDHVNLAINISPVQLQNPELADQVRAWAAESDFPMQRMVIEITESALVSDLAHAKQLAHRFRDMGCRLALDDFGTGYSSLSHLQSLPFDDLKIDRSFVASMVERRESRKIVAAVVGLGHSLELNTVAEGVETEEQADMLLWFGCEMAQGWLFGRPQPAESIPEMVAASHRHKPESISVSKSKAFPSSLEAFPTARLVQLRAIYESAPVGLCFVDRKLRFISLNQRYADLSGVPIEMHLGKTMKEVIPEVFPTIEPYIHRALSGEAVYDEEVVRPSHKPEGEDLITLLTYQPALDEAGEVIGISVAVADITSFRRVEEALRSSEQNYQTMVDLNPNVPWLLDSEGNVLNVGAQWMEMTGLTKEQSLKLGWLDALHPDDVGPTLRHLHRSVDLGGTVDVEYRVWDVEQGWRRMRARGAPRLDADGNVLFWYGVLEDIDERELIESRFREMSKLQS
jgi:PAS domain S-box-containing protein